MTVGIAGLGLIGGSFAKAYKKDGRHRVLGFDANPSVETIALAAGAMDGRLREDTLPECDLLLIALYPKDAIAYLQTAAPLLAHTALAVDCCGTKRGVCEAGFSLAAENGFTFVGGHPMAGTHTSGFASSRDSLFKGASMVLVPPVYDDIRLLERVKEALAPAEFGRFSVTTADEHDKMIAFTSQLAHAVSNAYIKSPTARRHKGFSAGSYKDLTRVAWLNPDMWTALFVENRDNLAWELDGLIKELTAYRDAVAEGDAQTLWNLLDEGRRTKEEVDG